MADALKNIFTESFIQDVAGALGALIFDFDQQKFISLIFNDEWPGYELKQRMAHIAETMHPFLPDDFTGAAEILKSIPEKMHGGHEHERLALMFIPNYVEHYGVDHPETALSAMETITRFASCEFAVRPLIKKYPEMLYPVLKKWAVNENYHVRRLASEGSRPRLPWAMALHKLIDDPSPVLPVLELLKDDSSEYVRRSVANHLNDISKDHPELAKRIFSEWIGFSANRDRLVKHGARTLLKSGDPDVMELFGFRKPDHILIKNFQILTPKIKTGDYLEFEVALKNEHPEKTNIRLEYAVYFLRSDGTYGKKVFRISEKIVQGDEEVELAKRHSFRKLSTRTYHPGKHGVSVIVNGVELGKKWFFLD